MKKFILWSDDMRRVLKFELNTKNVGFYAPPFAKFLLAGRQRDQFYVWLEVQPTDLPDVMYGIEIFGTGHEIGPNFQHLQSMQDGGFVWHVYRNTDYARFAN